MPFEPHPLLRNPHVQSFLSRSPLRKLRIRRAYGTAFDQATRAEILECGNGVRLQAWVTPVAEERGDAAPTIVLLHGWEGSAQSAYVYAPGAYLHARGHPVVRVEFRDHGGTQHLNADLFHANRLEEVIGAVRAACALFPERRAVLAGFSLGGNFAIRVAAGTNAGLPLAHVVAVNPVVCPASTSERLDTGPAVYRRYFLRKFRRSLRRKQACFPDRYDFSDVLGLPSITAMSDALVCRHLAYDSLDSYFGAYTITDDVLRGVRIPTTIIAAEDDPVLPVQHFRALAAVDSVTLDIQRYGGHCGYISDFRLRAWIERRLWDLARAADRAAVQASPSRSS